MKEESEVYLNPGDIILLQKKSDSWFSYFINIFNRDYVNCVFVLENPPYKKIKGKCVIECLYNKHENIYNIHYTPLEDFIENKKEDFIIYKRELQLGKEMIKNEIFEQIHTIIYDKNELCEFVNNVSSNFLKFILENLNFMSSNNKFNMSPNDFSSFNRNLKLENTCKYSKDQRV